MTSCARSPPAPTRMSRSSAKELRYAVQRQITDNETGKVLDVRRAVLVHITPLPEQGRPVMEVMEAERYDVGAERFATTCAERGWGLRVLDGRTLFADNPSPRGGRRRRAGGGR